MGKFQPCLCKIILPVSTNTWIRPWHPCGWWDLQTAPEAAGCWRAGMLPSLFMAKPRKAASWLLGVSWTILLCVSAERPRLLVLILLIPKASWSIKPDSLELPSAVSFCTLEVHKDFSLCCSKSQFSLPWWRNTETFCCIPPPTLVLVYNPTEPVPENKPLQVPK